MRRSLPIVVVTTFVFVWAVIWPDVARARRASPDPATAATVSDDPVLVAARQHFEAGRVAYNASDYPTAIREFKAAEALRPSPILAYNIGLANEKLQRRRVAVRYYKRYLEGAPTAANRGEVEGRIAALEKELAAQPQAQPVEQPQDNPPPPPPSADPNAQPTVQSASSDPYGGPAPMTTAPVQKKRNLWWVWLLVGLGSAAVVTAIVVGVYFGTRADPYYYYGAPIDADRLRAPVRRDLVDSSLAHGSALPAERRLADVSPVVELRF